jgi:predicted YcjX-like family ATPase
MTNLFRLKTTECRVGVVGQYNAGKTVFLTSLVNHLQDHDPDRFALGGRGTAVRKFERLPADPGWAEFNAAAYRDALVHRGVWPEKTADRLMYACRFERSDWSLSDVLLKLYDLPGERIADAAMLGRSYAEWSDRILDHVRDDTPYRECCRPFLDAIGKGDPTEDELVRGYKLALANLILAYKPLVTPSTFLLDKAGGKARPGTPEQIADARFSGIEAGSQFAPLPAALRGTPIGASFAARFDVYRDDVAAHFLAGLRSCHALIVMIDVTMLLAGGVGMYDDNRQMVHDLFRVLDPGESALGTVGRHLASWLLPVDLRPAWITRVAFVAPKLDLVHPADRDRVLTLLRRMVGRAAADRDGLSAEFFGASAVVSARPLPGDERMLVGVPLRGPDGRKVPPGAEHRFAPSRLPDDWPLSWEAGEYAFPEVYPQVPRRKDAPPEQINLDRVLSFVLG